MKELLLTDRALEDIAEIEEYSIKKWGGKVADKYLKEGLNKSEISGSSVYNPFLKKN